MMSQAGMLDGVAPHGIGVDIEPISSINMESETFLERNFTSAELSACRAKPDPRASLCARWCAKEAVVKALLSGTGERASSPRQSWFADRFIRRCWRSELAAA
jgi:phosphopantetheine--protein transferase-like protein